MSDSPEPASSSSDRDLARQQYDRGDYAAAIASYDRALQREPEDVDLLFMRGLAKHQKEDYAAAAADYTQILNKRPDYDHAFYNRGLCQRMLGQHKKALKDFNARLQLQPDHFDTLMMIGKCHVDLNDALSALAVFDRVLSLKPDHADGLFHRARAHHMLEHWQQAIDDNTEYLRLQPGSIGANLNRGLARNKLNDFRGAIEDYTQYLTKQPDDWKAYLWRGDSFLSTGEYQQALADYEQVLKIDPKQGKMVWPEIKCTKELLQREKRKAAKPSGFWKPFAFFPRWWKSLDVNGKIGVGGVVCLVYLVPILGWLLLARLASFFMSNPLFHDPTLGLGFFLLYLCIASLVCSLTASKVFISRLLEGPRVRRAILDHLRLPAGDEGWRAARNQVLALVRATGLEQRGRLAVLDSRRLWLCFLPRGLLVVSGSSGQVLHLPPEELRKSSLVDQPRRGRFLLSIDTGGDASVLRLARLADVVRVVNVLVHQGIKLGFQGARRHSPWGVRIAAGVVLLLVAVFALRPQLLTDRLPSRSMREAYAFNLRHDGKPLYITKAVFSPDGKRCVTIQDGYEGAYWNASWPKMNLWDVASGRELLSCPQLIGKECSRAAFSPDGRLLAVRHHGNVSIFDLVDGRELLAPEKTIEGGSNGIAFSADGKSLGTADVDELRIWNVFTGERVSAIGDAKGVSCLVFSPAGSRLATGHNDGTVNVWDAKNGRQLFAFNLDQEPEKSSVSEVVFSKDGNRLAASFAYPSKVLKVWDLSAGGETLVLQVGDADHLAFSPDGKQLAFAQGSSVSFWDVSPVRAWWEVKTYRQAFSLESPKGRVTGLAFSPDGRRLFAASHGNDADVFVWER